MASESTITYRVEIENTRELRAFADAVRALVGAIEDHADVMPSDVLEASSAVQDATRNLDAREDREVDRLIAGAEEACEHGHIWFFGGCIECGAVRQE